MAVNDLITFRKGTASQWISANPILGSGEPGYDLTNKVLKIGDGVSSWSGLSPVGVGLNNLVEDLSPQLGGNLDLNNRNITGTGNININGSGSFYEISFNTSLGDPDLTIGQLAWNQSEGTLDIGLNDNYNMHLGEEMLYRVRNSTGSTVLAGTPVYASGLTAGGNNRIEIAPHVANGLIREVRFMGLMTENCNAGINGYATHFGYIRSLDTRGDANANGYSNKLWASGEPIWAEGDILYVHPTIEGKLTKVEPKHSISVAIILNRHQNQGKIFVRPTSYGHLSDNHDVNVSGVAGGQFLQYDSVTDFWIPSNSGNFSSLQVNGTGVSISGHNHAVSDIIGFNSGVSGLLPVKNLIAGTGIVLSSSDGAFTINATSTGGGGGGGVSINNYSNNRVLTSDGSSTGIDAEGSLTFDGNRLLVNPSGSSSSFSASQSGVSIGNNASIHASGQMVIANGKFDVDGDAQFSQHVLRNQTSNSSWASLQNNNSSGVFLTQNKTYSFCANIVGRCLSESHNAAYKLEGLVAHNINAFVIIGTPIKTTFGETDSSWDVRSLISGDYLLIQVQGAVSQDINWVSSISLTEVGGYLPDNVDNYSQSLNHKSLDFIP
jgi:hypothetical protein